MFAERTLFCLRLLTTPSAPLMNGTFLFSGAATPRLKGGEWGRLETNPKRSSGKESNVSKCLLVRSSICLARAAAAPGLHVDCAAHAGARYRREHGGVH